MKKIKHLQCLSMKIFTQNGPIKHNKLLQQARNIKRYQTTTLTLPPQAGAYKLCAPSLEHIKWIWGPLKDLVRMSASWLLDLINSVLISLDCSFSWTKWQSISISLVLSWNTGLEATWRAAWLSQYNFISWTSQNFKRHFLHAN